MYIEYNKIVNPRVVYNEVKNLILKETRGVCFKDVIEAIKKGQILDDLKHKDSKKYPRQRILVVEIDKYVYAVPYVWNNKKGELFLKTVYPSRILTKKYLEKGK